MDTSESSRERDDEMRASDDADEAGDETHAVDESHDAAADTADEAHDASPDDEDDDDEVHELDGPLVIACDTGSALLASWIITLIVAGGAAYGAYSMLRYEQNWSRDWPILAAFVYVFPAVGALLLLATIWGTLRWRKQGVTKLVIPRGWAVEGDVMHGTVECSRELTLTGPAKAKLECLESRTVRRNNKSHTTTRQVWSEEIAIEPASKVITARNRAAADGGTHFAIKFRVPEIRRVSHAAPTERGVASASASVSWKLTVEAPTSGMDHESHFAVPILTKADSAKDEG